ncbi:lysozyme family protein [Actinoplanes sp. RD1]|uniref:murein transglycosylase n=1 Tax=Actinoplanes sp. RD1 TaxID=3064538 RepID=UPI0027428040|nr:murein transglycosylase [Actinoplanes sp. RD1]
MPNATAPPEATPPLKTTPPEKAAPAAQDTESARSPIPQQRQAPDQEEEPRPKQDDKASPEARNALPPEDPTPTPAKKAEQPTPPPPAAAEPATKHEPPAATAKQEPPAAAEQEPPAATAKQQPPAATAKQEPLAAAAQQPPAATAKHEPTAAAAEQEPSAVTDNPAAPSTAAKAEATDSPAPEPEPSPDKPEPLTEKATTPAAATSPATDQGKPETAPNAKGKKDKPDREPPAPSVTAMALASRSRPPKRKLRKAGPGAVARSTSEWAHRPSGRLILPAILAVVLIGAAGTAGAYLVPQALQSSPVPSATPAFGAGTAGAGSAGASVQPGGTLPGAAPSGTLPGAVPGGTQPGAVPSISVPAGVLPSVSSAPTVGGVPTTAVAVPGGVTQTRPADALATWAQQAGTRAGIPVVAVQAYGYAELVAARTTPGCHLSWTTLAAIGKVESSHGSFNGSLLNADGTVTPPIYGLPLDGQGGRQVIRDTDQGVLDKDATYDRAIGPMQFIPQTWNELAVGNAVDADGNGVPDPNDIDDAALAAALYLCKGGRDLSRPDAWWDAILSYNAVRPYAQKVFEAANQYGQLSRG